MPAWLADLRRNYRQEYEPHITFKQPCYIDEQHSQTLKEVFNQFMRMQQILEGPLPLLFDTLTGIDEPDTLMLSTQNAQLMQFQKAILEAFAQFHHYVDPRKEIYERNFEPHLTILADVELKVGREVLQTLPTDVSVTGVIGEIVLPIVTKDTPAEAKHPHNLTVVSL